MSTLLINDSLHFSLCLIDDIYNGIKGLNFYLFIVMSRLSFMDIESIEFIEMLKNLVIIVG